MEKWKDLFIDGKATVYIISNHGNLEHKYTGEKKRKHICKGYYRYMLKLQGVKKIYKAHRLVAIAFLDNPKKLPEVNHKDRNKLNNHVDNLEWSSGIDNINHYIKSTGRKVLDEDTIHQIINMSKHHTMVYISSFLGISVNRVSSLLNNRTYKNLDLYNE